MSFPSDNDWTFGNGGFVKIYGHRLSESSLLQCPVSTRWLFVWMLSQADSEGRVKGTAESLARSSRTKLSHVERSLTILAQPDPSSQSPEFEGRRIEKIPGGWQILNYKKYREFRSKRQVYEAEKKKRQRQRQRDMSRDVPECPGEIRTRHQIPDIREQSPQIATLDRSISKSTNKPSSTNARLQSKRAPNPLSFVVYWEDADETRDFGLVFEPVSGFEKFMKTEASKLELTMGHRELARFAQRSIVRFVATYSKRGKNGKTRGSRIGPKRLTEEFVGWVRSDLAAAAQRAAQPGGSGRTRASRIDDQARRLMGK